MDEKRAEFLTRMVEILGRLHDSSIQRGEPLLASVLAIAKGEAEDSLRHAEELASIASLRAVRSIAGWQPQDDAAAAEADIAA
jgi:hypothetical protein